MKKSCASFLFERIKFYLILSAALFIMNFISGCIPKDRTKPRADGDNNTALYPAAPSIHEAAPSIYEAAPTDTPLTPRNEEILNKVPIIYDAGMTMETRINTPAGYARIPSVKEELTGYLRGLKLKPSGSDILLYYGLPKADQDSHAAVFDIDIGENDLQQCADSIIRIYAEYYWSVGAYDKIAFHLTNGFFMEYTKWREGYRIVVNGNNVSWKKTKSYDDSYENFRNYLDRVFTYAGTLSLSAECSPIASKEILPGDIFLKGGSPGHCVLVVDAALDKNGSGCYLLAQGYMPAQDFHILKNPLHPEDPWYYASEITFPFTTPAWTFKDGSLVRWGDFKLNEAGLSPEFTDALPSS